MERRGWEPNHLVFIDESGARTNLVLQYGHCPRGRRLVVYAPHGHWKTTTFVVALREAGLTAYVDDPHRFQNARQVSSYAGLVPKRYQSGTMDRHGKIHKRGPRLLRGALVEAAWLTLRYNP